MASGTSIIYIYIEVVAEVLEKVGFISKLSKIQEV